MKNNRNDLFSTPVWGGIVKEQKYQAQDYLEYIKTMWAQEPSESKSNSGGGWQSRDNLHKDSIFKEFVNDVLIKSITSPILSDYNITNYKIQNMWANVNQKGSFNYHHIHEGYLSGVFYLKVPKNSGRLIFTNPCIRSEMHPIKNKNYPVNPEPFACIVFPSWLEHYVEPNMSDDYRVSISFNIGN